MWIVCVFISAAPLPEELGNNLPQRVAHQHLEIIEPGRWAFSKSLPQSSVSGSVCVALLSHRTRWITLRCRSCLTTSQSPCAAKGIAHASCHTSTQVGPWMLTQSDCVKLYLLVTMSVSLSVEFADSNTSQKMHYWPDTITNPIISGSLGFMCDLGVVNLL